MKKYILYGPITDKLELIKPLEISIEYSDDDGIWIASEEIFNMYGGGKTIEEAIDDYKLSLIEYYKFIEQKKDRNKETNELLLYLQTYISLKKNMTYILLYY